MMRFEVVDWEDPELAVLDAFPDRLVFQRRHWLEFLSAISRGKPVVGALKDGQDCVGYVTGIIVRRLGIPIFGSPCVGWTTPYLGFNLKPGIPRREALCALNKFVFDELGCAYIELCDRFTSPEDSRGLGFEVVPYNGYVSDLTFSEDKIFHGMKSMTRRAIRKANKLGVVIEEADPYGSLRSIIAN
jgi:hypothetical protein